MLVYLYLSVSYLLLEEFLHHGYFRVVVVGVEMVTDTEGVLHQFPDYSTRQIHLSFFVETGTRVYLKFTDVSSLCLCHDKCLDPKSRPLRRDILAEVNASFERDHALVDREFSSRVVEVPEPFLEEISQCTNLEERIVVGVAPRYGLSIIRYVQVTIDLPKPVPRHDLRK